MRNNIVICDDSRHDADRTKSILINFFQKYANDRDWNIKIYQDGISLIEDIKNGVIEPDIAFMDIDMESEEKNGIETAKDINLLIPQCSVIYLTNYLEYAPDIFLTEHLYFVLKGELEKRLPEIYIKMLNRKKEYQKVLRIELKKNQFVAINQTDVMYFERKGRKTFICGRDENWETYLSLNELENIIAGEGIIRCHNSFMVALRYIKSYVRESVIMLNGDNIPISRKYQPVFKQEFLRWNKEQIF